MFEMEARRGYSGDACCCEGASVEARKPALDELLQETGNTLMETEAALDDLLRHLEGVQGNAECGAPKAPECLMENAAADLRLARRVRDRVQSLGALMGAQ